MFPLSAHFLLRRIIVIYRYLSNNIFSKQNLTKIIKNVMWIAVFIFNNRQNTTNLNVD